MNRIKVSVICSVYNHESYLRKCLDGFVNQKCDFEYEVLIHDDASTDNSAEIIREYEQKYPDIIKPIYQTENQYSKGVKISNTYQYPRAKGEYLAWCEGDDYWTDELKLQKQVDFLDNHPDFSACAHCATMDYIGQNKTRTIPPNISQGREVSANEIILGGGGFFATNSFMTRKDLRLEMPSCFDAKGFGDYQLFMYSSFVGKVWCFKEKMSVYNFGTNNSWNERIWNVPEKREELSKNVINMYKSVDEYYEYKYHDAFDYKIRQTEFQVFEAHKNKKVMKEKKYKPFYRDYKKQKIAEFVKKHFPCLVKIRNKIVK